MIKVDCSTTARLLNRYVALVSQTYFDTVGEENKPIKTKTFYQIQWQNLKNDIVSFFNNPFEVAPRFAYSMLAIPLLFLGKHEESYNLAFFGAIAYDASAQTSHSGEPATITWSHTIGSGSDRLININVSGLSAPNAPKWDGNATTSINSVSNLKTTYYLNPSTGSANCTADGGNIKVGGSISFSGVDQTTPIGATTTEDGSSSPNDMTLTTTNNNSFRVDVLGSNRDDAKEPSGSLDSGDLRCNDIVPQNQFRIGLFAYTNYQATAGSDTHQWTTSGFNRWYSAFEINEAATTASISASRRMIVMS